MEHGIRKIYNVYKQESQNFSKSQVDFDNPRLAKLVANLYSPGPSYQYILDFPTFSFDYVSSSVKDVLGEDPKNFSPQKVFERIHPDDRALYAHMEEIVAHFIFKHIQYKEIYEYKVSFQYRMRTITNDYHLFLHQISTLALDDLGKLAKTFGNHSDISHITTINNRTVSFIGLNGKRSYIGIRNIDDIGSNNKELNKFSQRELEILGLTSEGLTSSEIASTLNISTGTVRTHRKNILAKSNCNNITGVVALAIRQGLL